MIEQFGNLRLVQGFTKPAHYCSHQNESADGLPVEAKVAALRVFGRQIHEDGCKPFIDVKKQSSFIRTPLSARDHRKY
jgi:hypothetical protein